MSTLAARAPFLAFCVASLAGCAEAPAPTDEERLAARLDRVAVHLHVALRGQLDGREGPALATRVIEASASREVADAIADDLFGRRAEGAERLHADRRATRAITPRLVEGGALDPDTERAALFVSLLAESRDDDRRIPKQVLVYEASRLDLARVTDPTLRRLARAGRALVFAQGGYCDLVDRELRALSAAELTAEEARATSARWMPEAEVDAASLHASLRRAVAVLGGGAEACCQIRRGRDADAASSVERWIDDAEVLGVSESRVAILRGWVALARSDREAAREQLARIRDTELDPSDTPRYGLIRDALASDGPNGLGDATERLVDRRWISSLVLSSVVRVFEEDGTLEALAAHPEAGAIGRLARGEAAVFEAARARHPLIDQAHASERGALERLGDLFR